jgi:hypothetical protein
VIVTLLFAVPAALCFVATIRLRRRRLLIFGLVAALAFSGVFVYSYLTAAHDSSGSSCSDCQQFVGRYWEPDLVAFLALVASVGVILGAGVGSLVAAFLPGQKQDGGPTEQAGE